MEGDKETEMVKLDVENAIHSHSSEHEIPPPFLPQIPKGGWRSIFYILGNVQERFHILRLVNYQHAFLIAVLEWFLGCNSDTLPVVVVLVW